MPFVLAFIPAIESSFALGIAEIPADNPKNVQVFGVFSMA